MLGHSSSACSLAVWKEDPLIPHPARLSYMSCILHSTSILQIKAERTELACWILRSSLTVRLRVSCASFLLSLLKGTPTLQCSKGALVVFTSQTLCLVLCSDRQKSLTRLSLRSLLSHRRSVPHWLRFVNNHLFVAATAEAITSDLPVSSIMDRLLDVNICTSSSTLCLDSPHGWD